MVVREVKMTYKGRGRPSVKLDSPENVYKFFKKTIKGELRENLYCVHLNTKNMVVGWELISVGTQTETLVHPREVFLGAIRNGACTIIIFHNHPSGCLAASNEDRTTCGRLAESGKILGIQLLDFLILTEDSFLSFKEEQIL